jgi:hypothetical protein
MTPAEKLHQYYRRHKQNKRSTFESIIHDLWRAHPEWDSTYSKCCVDGCDKPARGGYLCPDCLVECLGELTGSPDAAEAMRKSIVMMRESKRSLMGMMEGKK